MRAWKFLVQSGDVERRLLLVRASALPEVAKVVRAYRRKRVADQSLKNLRPFRHSP
jgi:hypothetical protein